MTGSLTSTHPERAPTPEIRPIRSLLIANRGEIVVRVARTARAMGIKAVAVYSEPDASALHVEACDESLGLGGETPVESYLNIPKLIDAAARAKVDAVHPGYGFLSENSAFAEAVIAAGLTWVGPRPETIARMGDKVAAKRTMADAGVPVLEDVLIVDGTDVRDAAAILTPPIIVKAAAGGGGKGMRIVTDLAELPAMVEACRREAAGAFGDDRVFLERFVARPRHIEVQIVGDRWGHVIHLLERECSIQRRHQKVLEESPSPAVDDALRELLCSAAVAAGKVLRYEGAGTVEFVVGAQDEPAFLEVNTRLQVEHPVTEAITGVDLVRLQLIIAEGRALPLDQADIASHGHAIEARLYAEDPAHGYLPAAGRLVDFRPTAVDDVRWDAGVRTGSIIGPHYDPMLAKVIAWGESRDEAARRLGRALLITHVHGPATNRDLLCAVLGHPDFLAGTLTTSFLDDRFPTDQQRASRPTAEVLTWAAVIAALAAEAQRTAGWTLPSGWRNNRTCDQVVTFESDGRIDVAYRLERDGSWVIRVGERVMRVVRHSVDAEQVDLSVDGHRIVAFVSSTSDSTGVQWEVTTPRGHAHLVELLRFPDPAPLELVGATRAPMHGRVVSVAVSLGDRVTKGQLLCIVEAMKMEQQVVAPYDAVVTSISLAVGDSVETNQVLIVLEEEA